MLIIHFLLVINVKQIVVYELLYIKVT